MRSIVQGMSSLPYIAGYCICAVETTHDYSGEMVQSWTWRATLGLMAHLQLVDILPTILNHMCQSDQKE
eukprot:12923412-Prorocentrum_lima.AAC.1